MSDAFHERAKALFTEALARPAGDREAFIAEACDGDGALAQELRSLLNHHDEATLLDLPAAAPPRPRPPETDFPTALGQRFWGTLWRPDRRSLLLALATLGALALLAAALEHHLQESLEASVQARLEAVRDMSAREVGRWMEREGEYAQLWAAKPVVSKTVATLVAEREAGAPPSRAHMEALRRELDVVCALHRDGFFAVIDEAGHLLAWTDPADLLHELPDGLELGSVRIAPRGAAALRRAFDGEVVLLPPYTEGAMVQGFQPVFDEARMAALAPVPGPEGEVIAVLAFGFDASTAFTDILLGGRLGETGETYAVDDRGLLLSESLFADQLHALGLLPEGTPPMLNLRVVDPGSDLTRGGQPDGAGRLTDAASALAAGHDGHDVTGYRDYRGVEVVGAWAWLEDLGLGLITEVDVTQAYAPLAPIEALVWLLFGLLSLALLALIGSTWHVSRLRASVHALGQYHLDELIGRGGMGVVYRARHAMLRRPTAVKLLEPEHMSPEAIQRFEREVQLTSQLTHPNTVEIYDYGRTPSGLFYYAMELLPGPTLAELVEREGPLPVPRAVHLLDQVCASLEDAHAHGLVHRDIKPSNIIVCERGGRHDVVKVLDFGLVKSLESHTSTDIQATATGAVAGTPVYMAPERLRQPREVDARADLYSVGALAFHLLTGRDVFEGGGALEVLSQVLEVEAPRVADLSPGPVPRALDDLLAACLAKDPDRRPDSATTVRAVLAGIMDETGPWTEDQARAAADPLARA